MNFLSHYYFDRENQDSNLVIGTVLPDLAKNAHKDWNFYPQKSEDLFTADPILNSILIGWKRHLKVDILFHSSDFFSRHTANLKLGLLPILTDSPVRPSFLAHIGVELLLDHLLIEDRKIDINAFYDHLANVDEQGLTSFIEKCGGTDTEHFFKFLNSFKSSRYLLSYQKLENISYALQRICMRLWAHPFHEETVAQLTEQLTLYKEELEKDYLTIYEEIEMKLKD
jgi:acyl carrier protein phosphodiesterase